MGKIPENLVCLLGDNEKRCCEHCRLINRRESGGLESSYDITCSSSTMENSNSNSNPLMAENISPSMKKVLLILNCMMLGLGISGGPLVMRLYYLHGGKSIWLSAWLETGGWPLMIVLLLVSFVRRRAADSTAKPIFINLRTIFYAAFVGIVAGLADYLYAFGVKHIPVSTTSLILATQLAFTAGFTFLLVGQKFTAYSINAVALLTFGAAVLALHVSSDIPAGTSHSLYLFGFFATLASAALYALMLPLIEVVYMKCKQAVTFPLVMEIQLVLSFSATALCTIGMLVSGDYKYYTQEAKDYKLGIGMYFVVLTFSAIIWQFFYLGAAGVIYYGSSLLSGVIIAISLPVTEILAVLLYHEKFQVEKGMSLVLSMWGFLSYFYGEAKASRKKKKKSERQRAATSIGAGKV